MKEKLFENVGGNQFQLKQEIMNLPVKSDDYYNIVKADGSVVIAGQKFDRVRALLKQVDNIYEQLEDVFDLDVKSYSPQQLLAAIKTGKLGK